MFQKGAGRLLFFFRAASHLFHSPDGGSLRDSKHGPIAMHCLWTAALEWLLLFEKRHVCQRSEILRPYLFEIFTSVPGLEPHSFKGCCIKGVFNNDLIWHVKVEEPLLDGR